MNMIKEYEEKDGFKEVGKKQSKMSAKSLRKIVLVNIKNGRKYC